MITPSFLPTATERVLPKLALDFTTAVLDPRVTFTRTTSASNPATYVNSSGVLVSATNNQPRFDYNPTTLACKGLLIEESRTNSLTQSNNFDNVAWSKTEMLFGANATTSPDGTSNATKLIPSTASSSLHRIYVLTSGANAFSVYAKAGEYYGLRLFADGFDTIFNLSNGTVASGTGTIASAGNGWYRCSAAATITSAQIVVYPTASTSQYTGDGTSGLYVYGAQLEAGAFPTSYIPTSGSALTRNADVATMTGTNFSDWFNASEGSIVTWSIPNTSSYTSAATVQFVTDGNNYMGFYPPTSNTSRAQVRTLGVNEAIITKNPMPTATIWKQGFAYKLNNIGFSVNGASVGTDTSANIPTVANLYVGQTVAGEFINTWLQKIYYYPQRLLLAELNAFTN